MKKLIAYDLGTGGIKASLFTDKGDSLADVFIQYETLFPQARFIEQRPMDWWNHVCAATRKLLESTRTDAAEIAGIALSGHSLVAVPIAADGHLMQTQVPIWCDMRAVQEAEELFQTLDYDSWYLTTGNGDPAECYTITKLMWMKKHQPDIYEKMAKILGSKDFINYMLTGRLCTDPSYASGFGVFNLKEWQYETKFIQEAGLRADIFPEICPSDAIIGTVTREAAALTGLAEGTPVACGAVDNTCMALGARGLREGVAYTSLGSSSWIAVTSTAPIVDPATRPFVFAHAKKGYYTSAVSIFSAGNSFRWIRDHLCRDLKDDTDTYDLMNQMAESVPAGSNGVLFNPSLAGGSAQEPSPDLKGGFMGLSLSTTREDMVRAAMEGIAMALRCTLDVLLKQTSVTGEMLICGGGSKSAVWRQMFADIYNLPVLKTNIDQNAASLGAAALAANACSLWDGYDVIAKIHKTESIIWPNSDANARYEQLLPVFRKWSEDLAELSQMMKVL